MSLSRAPCITLSGLSGQPWAEGPSLAPASGVWVLQGQLQRAALPGQLWHSGTLSFGAQYGGAAAAGWVPQSSPPVARIGGGKW